MVSFQPCYELQHRRQRHGAVFVPAGRPLQKQLQVHAGSSLLPVKEKHRLNKNEEYLLEHADLIIEKAFTK